MRRRRFFWARLPAEGERAPLPAELAHYARNVLRLPVGTSIELFNGEGRAVEATLLDDGVEITRPVPFVAGAVPMQLACPLLKGERSDWLLEKLTELGIASFMPLDCERAVIRELSSNKRTRFERVIEAACRQCGRNDRLRLAELTPLSALPPGVFLDPTATAPFDVLCDELFSNANRGGQLLTVAIGPEGGFSSDEREHLLARSWRSARLSAHVLRAETAALMAASVAAMRWAG